MKTLNKGLSFDNVATQLKVSVASIRNWIKTGYLIQVGKNMVTQESFDNFKKNIAGGEKLTARANKSFKDTHNHDILLKKYNTLINNNKVNGYELGLSYEKELSNSYRNKEGIYYTPSEVVKHFFQYLPKDFSSLSFCDPCCGSGNFIIEAIKHGVSPENIYGYDIDPFAVNVTRKRIFDHTGYKTDTIQLVDFLDSSSKSNQIYFDVIFTNPPWGKKLNKKQKNHYATTLHTGKSVDTSSLFFFSCLTKLSEGGYLGFLLQEAFFNIASYEQARKKALELEIISIIDFGKPFKGLLTKAKGIVIKNTLTNKKNTVKCSNIKTYHNRLQDSFSTNTKSILNSNASQEESKVISHLYSLPHITLKGKAKWGLGIVTGNNKKFIRHSSEKDHVAAYKGSDIEIGKLNGPSSYIPSNLSLYQQVAPIELFQAKEKLIYKFISSKLVFFCDWKQRYILNSANMLILKKDFPISHIQLSQILNSKIINWLFRTIFNTHKVLRSDIEILPIHTDYFNDNPIFDECAFNKHLNVEELKCGSFRIKNRITTL